MASCSGVRHDHTQRGGSCGSEVSHGVHRATAVAAKRCCRPWAIPYAPGPARGGRAGLGLVAANEFRNIEVQVVVDGFDLGCVPQREPWHGQIVVLRGGGIDNREDAGHQFLLDRARVWCPRAIDQRVIELKRSAGS